MKSNILLVKHLPSTLSILEKEDLLKCFGATDVRVMSNNGKLKNSAFCTFADESHASEALVRLHQLDLLDTVLKVEYSQQVFKLVDSASIEPSNKENKIQEKSKIVSPSAVNQSCRCSRQLPVLAPKFGLEYNANPGLKYKYPEPNADILLNICGALLAVPKFYTQVLHLMNKMNLYAPFTPATFVPPILLNHFQMTSSQQHDLNTPFTSSDRNLRHRGSSSESEMESDEPLISHNFNVPPPERATKALKRKMTKLCNSPKRKFARMKEAVVANVTSSDAKDAQKNNLSTVFEPVSHDSLKRNIDLHVPSSITAKIESNLENESILSSKESVKVSNSGEVGFGKIIPLEKPINIVESDTTTDYIVTKNFITEKQLQEGKLSSKDQSSHPLFKNYNSGQPSCRLYVKNLPKKATEKDLQHIFGKFVNFENEDDAKMFDVRVMTQGRMKGQAFIGLPSVLAAQKAIRLVNGYQLMGKPLVVMFARSAKPINT